MTRHLLVFVAVVVLLAGLPFTASTQAAAHNAFDVPDSVSTISAGTGNFILGFEFTLSDTIEVTHLGKMDWYGDGLPESASAGIWSTAQPAAPLVSALIPAGAAADLVEYSGHGTLHYYYEEVTPVQLTPGTYRIGVTSGSETFAYDLTPITLNIPGAWTQGVADFGSALSYPDDILRPQPHAYMGANFKFNTPAFSMGDFEEITVSGYHKLHSHGDKMGVWSVENNTGEGGALYLWNADNLESVFPDINASSGAQMVTLQAAGNLGTISQAFETMPGQEYEVTFDLSALVNNDPGLSDQTLELLVSAAADSRTYSILTETPAPGDTVKTLPWQNKSFRFTATDELTTLELSNQVVYLGEVNWGLTIDNLQLAEVPEPALSVLLMTVTVFGCFWRRRL